MSVVVFVGSGGGGHKATGTALTQRLMVRRYRHRMASVQLTAHIDVPEVVCALAKK